jgi:hypothetical protein
VLLVGRDVEVARAPQQQEALGPEGALAQLGVQQLEQSDRPVVLALAGQGPGDADEVVDVDRTLFDPLQPGVLDRREVFLAS